MGVIRSQDEARARTVADGLLAGGLRAVEFTSDTPGCFGLVAELSRRARGVVVGVGTVTELETVAAARAAGASFVVCPHTDPELVLAAVGSGLVAIPGAFTATEIVAARRAGADFVKLFPVSAGGGPTMVRAMRGPFRDVPFWVSGDVSIEQIPDYLAAGADLIGLTTALVGELGALSGSALSDAAADRAAACLAAAAEARDGQVVLTIVAPVQTLRLDVRALRRMPGPEHVPIDAVVPGRRGHGVRIRRLLEHLRVDRDAPLLLRSADGFSRQVFAAQLYDGGVLQYALDGRPLDAAEGGPLRLYLVDGTDRCDNVKGLSRIEVLTRPSET